jgi:hypothetical protein
MMAMTRFAAPVVMSQATGALMPEDGSQVPLQALLRIGRNKGGEEDPVCKDLDHFRVVLKRCAIASILCSR